MIFGEFLALLIIVTAARSTRGDRHRGSRTGL